ncbi:hypothetical protein BASA50_007889 [Batrachochytrium salamandrivorans]|uniref:Secreted protein n=1 Tax=Batrachochytrium salamandrivorans TaxID=1357716 RepID=A0ABQ8F5R2_9FUNG|nr:hypothetical protein BASA50_007889 [Batrachochytrium salamandrivorans]KAH9255665.1 hypothetical protein BASA81_006271 [Batrachochytrium salamandrivorans]
MRLSTGIILSILSANVFAIENLNDVHPGSLLARRAVMADTDGVFLQKRGDDEGKKKQAKSKHSLASNSGKGRPIYTKLGSKDDSDSDSESSSSDEAEEESTNLTAQLLDKDGGATGGSEDGHTKVDFDQEELGFVDVIGRIPIKLISSIKKKLTRENSEPGLIPGMNRALAASQKMTTQFSGEMGESIGTELYRMFEHALKTAWNYQEMYNNPAKSPFDLKLPSVILDQLRERYESLRKEAPEYIELYITAIEDAIKNIFTAPENVIFELKKIMRKTDGLHMFILDMRLRYSSLLASLIIPESIYIQDLDAHLEDIRTYELKLASYFKIIKEMAEDAPQSPNQQGLSKSFSPMPRFRKRLGSKPKSPKSGASHSAQSSGGASNPMFSDDE